MLWNPTTLSKSLWNNLKTFPASSSLHCQVSTTINCVNYGFLDFIFPIPSNSVIYGFDAVVVIVVVSFKAPEVGLQKR